MEELSDTLHGIGRNFETFKKAQDQRLGSIEAFIDRFDGRVKALEVQAEGIGGRGFGGGVSPANARKSLEIFAGYLRDPKSQARPDDWMALASPEYQHQVKAMSIGSAADGGVAVPEAIESDIKRRAADLNPLRELCRVVGVTTAPSSYKVPASRGGTASGWVGESGSRSETATPTLALPSFPDGEVYATPKLSNWSMDDIPGLQNFIATEVGEAFGNQEATAFLSGSGTNQPKGIFGNTPVATDDDASPQRAAFTLEYLPIAVGSSPATKINPDNVIELQYLLKAGYWPRATWVANRRTLSALRRLKDTTGQYLWQAPLAAGQAPTLLGLPIRVCDAMASPAANALSLLLADFQSLYTILERPTRLIVDQVTSKGQTLLYFSKRVSGHVVDDHAGKVGKIAAS
jgi:HK97 family phage major capsid protein